MWKNCSKHKFLDQTTPPIASVVGRSVAYILQKDQSNISPDAGATLRKLVKLIPNKPSLGEVVSTETLAYHHSSVMQKWYYAIYIYIYTGYEFVI